MSLSRLRPLATPLIRVGPSTVHGTGAFATGIIPKGTPLGLYAGKRYRPEAEDTITADDTLTYLFVLSDGTTIDAARGGNATRHLNHSCAPNCEAVEDYDASGLLVLQFRTLRKIRAGEELFIDYRLQAEVASQPSDYLCACGASTCRGTMLDPEHPGLIA
ncbi:MAG: SET domain-containing protein-lysine N-methyltransferase [Burkholderiaceae bacterium]